jgi:hypothetical protein
LPAKIVHGSAVTEDDLNAAMNGSYLLLRDLLLSSIEKGHALTQKDFDNAVFY